MTASRDELEQSVLETLVKARYRDRLVTLRARSRQKFVQLLFRTHRQSPQGIESADVWRSELFELVPVPFQASGDLVQRLRKIQATPWYVVAQTGLDERRVDPGEIIENAHQAGLIAVTDDLEGAYLELEGKNASWVAGTAKRVLG